MLVSLFERLISVLGIFSFFKKIDKNYLEFSKEKTLLVSFTGGMGAQILSAAVFFHLQSRGFPVKADLDYFNRKRYLAKPGNQNEISHWDWQLDDYGLTMDSFTRWNGSITGEEYHLADGPLKLRLAMQALQCAEVKRYFEIPPLSEILKGIPQYDFMGIGMEPYICMHIRRGDYLNVASYVVPDEHFVELGERFKRLAKTVVIVSDSTLSEALMDAFKDQFKNAFFLDDPTISPFVTHCVMRYASILVCSNSQFSLTAGALNDGLVVVPKTWLGAGHDQLKAEIEQLSDFSVLS